MSSRDRTVGTFSIANKGGDSPDVRRHGTRFVLTSAVGVPLVLPRSPFGTRCATEDRFRSSPRSTRVVHFRYTPHFRSMPLLFIRSPCTLPRDPARGRPTTFVFRGPVHGRSPEKVFAGPSGEIPVKSVNFLDSLRISLVLQGASHVKSSKILLAGVAKEVTST